MEYAILPNRVKAVVIDGVVLICCMYLVSELFASFESVPDYVRMAAFVVIFVLYDPIFTSAFGGTLGHSYSGIVVKRENDTKKNLIFPLAVIRFLVKSLLGWLSLLTVTGSDKKQAIHDRIVGSVVLDSESKK
ncbi:RDD family protein [Flagellimonas algicola]|uniref:RDD family protein n=1 Tax=Flagellimonas algicola TaxID=2583815 RepID=A0ABY2WGC5_9FLAO|nr:RDD family protein [Allomuricauda algicola]TMU50595.1 RDD family protein [Allomuricauda algicola]